MLLSTACLAASDLETTLFLPKREVSKYQRVAKDAAAPRLWCNKKIKRELKRKLILYDYIPEPCETNLCQHLTPVSSR
jgi:hypothetical protein